MVSEMYRMMFEKNVVSSWYAIGRMENLRTDSDIATFLMDQYHRNTGKGLRENSGLQCVKCHSHLTFYCANCGVSYHQPSRSPDQVPPALGTLPIHQVATFPEDSSPGTASCLGQDPSFEQHAVILSEPAVLLGDSSSQQDQALPVQVNPPLVETRFMQEDPPLQRDSSSQQDQALPVQVNPPLVETGFMQEDPPLQRDSSSQQDQALPVQVNPPLVETGFMQEDPPLQRDSSSQQDQALPVQVNPPLVETGFMQEDPPLQQERFHAENEVLVPQDELLGDCGSFQEDLAVSEEGPPLQLTEAGFVHDPSLTDTGSLLQDPRLHQNPSVQAVQDLTQKLYQNLQLSFATLDETVHFENLKQTAPLQESLQHGRAEPCHQDAQLEQIPPILSDHDYSYHHPISLDHFLQLQSMEQKSVSKGVMGQDLQAFSTDDGKSMNEDAGEVRFQTSGDLGGTLEGGSHVERGNLQTQEDVDLAFTDFVESLEDALAPEITESHYIPFICHTIGNQPSEMATSSQAGTTEIKRSVLKGRSGTRAESGLKQSPVEQWNRACSGTQSIQNHSSALLSGKFQIDKELVVLLEKCDKVSEEPPDTVLEEDDDICDGGQEEEDQVNRERNDCQILYAGAELDQHNGRKDFVSDAASAERTASKGRPDTTDLLSDGSSAAGNTEAKANGSSWSTEVQVAGVPVKNMDIGSPHREEANNSVTPKPPTVPSDMKEPPGERQISGPFHCRTCQRRFPGRRSLRNHEKQSHAQSGSFLECDLCGLKFMQERGLARHKAKEHPENGHLQCNLCDFQCRFNKDMRNHKKKEHYTHSSVQCELCGLKLSGQSFKAHLLRHVDEKPFPCNQCGQKFRSLSKLNDHARGHHGEIKKPFRCNKCPKGFVKKQSLTNHMMTHEGLKPHRCSQCVKAFVRKDNLAKHMRTHTGEKPYQCDVCHHRFSCTSSLKTHKKKQHGGTDQNSPNFGYGDDTGAPVLGLLLRLVVPERFESEAVNK